MSDSSEWQLVRLQARIASLEAALRRRSEELRHIQQRLPAADLAVIAQVMAEMAPGNVRAYSPEAWRETFQLAPSDIEAVLDELWRSTRGQHADPAP